MPEWARVSLIDASPFDAGTAYVAVDRHQFDDLRPYIYKTSDYGKTWTKLTQGIPDTTFVRAVREDPKKRGLLYAGTEQGVFVSFNDGANWRPLQLNLPTTPVHDLVIKETTWWWPRTGERSGFWTTFAAAAVHRRNRPERSLLVHAGDRVPDSGGSQRGAAHFEGDGAESCGGGGDLLLPEGCAQGGDGDEDRNSGCVGEGDSEVFEHGVSDTGGASASGRQEAGEGDQARSRA